jgi:hypothetical protein
MYKIRTYEIFLEVQQGSISPEDAQMQLVEMFDDIEEETTQKEIVDGITYTGRDMLTCDLGIYRIFWKSGGSSVASIGMTYSGKRWVAPSNWTNGSDDVDPTGRLDKMLKDIEKITLIHKQ